jgi:EAL domain-containing protein (putative c-di-GMP-specific phosphodiesterase class I)
VARVGQPVESGVEGVLAVRMDRDQVQPCAEILAALLTPAEQEDCRSLLVEEGTETSLADLLRMESLARWIAQIRSRYVMELIEDGLHFHFQPIVYSRAPDSVFAFECLARGQRADGTLIPPTTIYRDAHAAGLLFPLDRAARLSAIRQAVQHGLTRRLFINFNPSSIYDPATCLRSTVAAISEAGLPPGRVTFEIVESERADPKQLASIVQYYRSVGFRVALDDLGAGYSSLNLLHALKPDYVKLDRELTSGVDRDPYKACIAAPLLGMARDLGIETVAEGVETPGELAWLQDHDVDYVQGFLICRPGLPPFAIEAPDPGGRDGAEASGTSLALRVAE